MCGVGHSGTVVVAGVQTIHPVEEGGWEGTTFIDFWPVDQKILPHKRPNALQGTFEAKYSKNTSNSPMEQHIGEGLRNPAKTFVCSFWRLCQYHFHSDCIPCHFRPISVAGRTTPFRPRSRRLALARASCSSRRGWD